MNDKCVVIDGPCFHPEHDIEDLRASKDQTIRDLQEVVEGLRAALDDALKLARDIHGSQCHRLDPHYAWCDRLNAHIVRLAALSSPTCPECGGSGWKRYDPYPAAKLPCSRGCKTEAG